MEQSALYKMLKASGFEVLVFEDHPQFFGNWRADIRHGYHVYEIVSDNREGWITLWRRDDDRGVKLFESESSSFSQERELTLIQQWLDEVKRS
jgi:hypothetical protein